jgi:hypothetical protein
LQGDIVGCVAAGTSVAPTANAGEVAVVATAVPGVATCREFDGDGLLQAESAMTNTGIASLKRASAARDERERA